MSEKVDVSPEVAFAESSAAAGFWQQRSMMNAVLRDQAERKSEQLKIENEALRKRIEQLESTKDDKNGRK